MSEQQNKILETDVGITEKDNETRSAPVSKPLSYLVKLIHLEHNYNFVLPDQEPRKKNHSQSKRTLRQLVCSLHEKIHPGKMNELSLADMEEQIRRTDLIQRRLRRLLASTRRFVDFAPMSQLQEAILEEMAKEMECSTRFYCGQDGRRYMVAYRPGIGPNTIELKARNGDYNCGLEILPANDKKTHTRKSLQSQKILWHQKMELEDRHLAEYSRRLGWKILQKFNAMNDMKENIRKGLNI